MTLAIIFPHPLTGSLGSLRRVEEITTTLRQRLNIETNIYSPYERRRRILPGNNSITPIPNYATSLGLNAMAYRLSKYVYYNRTLSRKLLIRSLGLSKHILSERVCDMFRRDQVNAIQAELDVSLPLAVKLGQELGVPVVADLHNISAEELVATEVVAPDDKVYTELQCCIGKSLLNVDRVCVVSEMMKKYVMDYYAVSSRKILVVPPGSRPNPRSVVSRNKRDENVVFAGTVSHREHVDLFIRSLPYVLGGNSQAKFSATRRGEDLRNIMNLCKRLHLKVNWVWFSQEKDLVNFLGTCALGVLPSSADIARVMGTPIKLFDYMAAGLPVVANRVGGWSELIEQEKIGILTRDDPKDFARGILDLLQDEDLRARFSDNALAAVREKYNWDLSVEPLARFYEGLF